MLKAPLNPTNQPGAYIGVATYGARAPFDLQQFIFSALWSVQSLSTVASCKNPVTFECAPPGDATGCLHLLIVVLIFDLS